MPIAIESLVGANVRASKASSREFLGPSPVRAAAGRPDRLERLLGARGVRAGLKARLLRVHSAAESLTSANANSVLISGEATSVRSSRSAAVSAEAIEGGTRAGSGTFRVKVTNLAVAQVNEGQALTSSATNTIATGTNKFTIKTVSGPTKTVSFTTDTTDTNAEALAKLVDAINAADAGITASVTPDTDAGTVKLVLTADSTGLGSAFEVADSAGNVIGTTGVSAATTAAERAEFVIDGVAGSSDSNTVDIDEGRVRLTLKMETGPVGNDDEVGASVTIKSDVVSEAILELAGALNSLRDFATEDGSASSLRIQKSFTELLIGRKGDLETVGIDVGEEGELDEGKLRVDRDKLESALSEKRSVVDGLFGSVDGVGAKVARVAEDALGDTIVRSLQNARLGESESMTAGTFLTTLRGSHRGLLVDVFG